MDNKHTLAFTRMAARICLSKHSPLSGSEVGPMRAVSPKSLLSRIGSIVPFVVEGICAYKLTSLLEGNEERRSGRAG